MFGSMHLMHPGGTGWRGDALGRGVPIALHRPGLGRGACRDYPPGWSHSLGDGPSASHQDLSGLA